MLNKEEARGKELNSSQSAKSSEMTNNPNVLDCVRLNNAERLITGHLAINSFKNKFQMLRQIVQVKLEILLISETKVDPYFPSKQFVIEAFSSPI